MSHKSFVTALAIVSMLGMSTGLAYADDDDGRRRSSRVRRAVPRGVAPPVVHVRPRLVRPQIVAVAPYRYHSPRFRTGLYYGYPYGSTYGHSTYGYSRYGHRSPGFYAPVAGYEYGGVRIDLPQRDAQVYVGGYYVGIVDEFDGVFQQLNLEPGPHRIEIREPGFVPIAFDVRVQPGRTITYRASMQPEYP